MNCAKLIINGNRLVRTTRLSTRGELQLSEGIIFDAVLVVCQETVRLVVY